MTISRKEAKSRFVDMLHGHITPEEKKRDKKESPLTTDELKEQFVESTKARKRSGYELNPFDEEVFVIRDEPRPNHPLRSFFKSREWSDRRIAEAIGTNTSSVNQWMLCYRETHGYIQTRLEAMRDRILAAEKAEEEKD
jgi:hypothetical protein